MELSWDLLSNHSSELGAAIRHPVHPVFPASHPEEQEGRGVEAWSPVDPGAAAPSLWAGCSVLARQRRSGGTRHLGEPGSVTRVCSR